MEDCAPFALPATHVVCYHYVVEGELQVQASGGAPMTLGPGDVVLFPHNDRHLMGSDLSLPPVDADEIVQPPTGEGLATIRHGGGGAVTRVVCGFLGCDEGETNPVISALPQAIRLSVEEAGASEWIRSTFQFAADEVAAGRPGSATVLAKLSELLFVEAVRRYANSLPEEETGWLSGLKDPYVARALAMLHDDIARDWTVDELSGEVGLSRSAFADRFTRLIGKSPMQYLSTWRMQRAAQLLQESNLALSQIAAEVGYESDAAFSRAFKKAYDAAPATWRKAHAA